MQMKCTQCQHTAEEQAFGKVTRPGQYPGDSDVSYNCPQCGSDLVVPVPPCRTVTEFERQVDNALAQELQDAEDKAWDSLRRYKFQMFGYWAAIWVHLNRVQSRVLGTKPHPNPWQNLAKMAGDWIVEDAIARAKGQR